MAWRLVSLLAILAVCDAGVAKFDPRVVNGEDAKPGEFPYIVSLQTPGINFHFCGGSVLNADYVLTAAHCLESKSPSGVQVVAGTVHLDSPHSVHAVEKIIIHADYDSSDSWINDIALIKVKTPFVASRQISFVALPEEHEIVNANDVALLAGWGRLWQWGPSTKQLQKAYIYIADQDQCRKVYRQVAGTIYDTHVCANDPSVERGACNGDSGGPLSVNGKIAGIVSWSMGCALTDYPTVYTRVSSYLDWIAANAV